MLKHLDEGKMTLEREIDKILKTGDISVSTLEKLHKLTDTYKNMCKIEMYAELEDGGESYEDGVSYARGRGRNARRDSMGRYSRDGRMTDGYSDEGSSYARGGRGGQGGSRGGSYRGGSSYEGGYSQAKNDMMSKIEEMMDDVDSPKERRALKECMEALEKA